MNRATEVRICGTAMATTVVAIVLTDQSVPRTMAVTGIAVAALAIVAGWVLLIRRFATSHDR